MHWFRLMVIASALWALGATAVGQGPSADAANDEHVRKTVTTFWKAFGDLDANGLRATLDWPNMMVQARSRTATGPAMVNTDAVQFEAEVRRLGEGRSEGRKGDFYGTSVARMEVRFLSGSVASVHHVCRLGGQAGATAERRRGTRDFEAIAVLRATGEAAAPWKIVLITIPE